MNAPRDGNDDPTGLLAEADRIRYGDQDYIPDAWRGQRSATDYEPVGAPRKRSAQKKKGGGRAKSTSGPDQDLAPQANGPGADAGLPDLLICAVTSCERPAFIPKRRGRQLGLCSMHQQTSYQIAKRCSLTWPPPGRILRLVSRRRYQQGERLSETAKAAPKGAA